MPASPVPMKLVYANCLIYAMKAGEAGDAHAAVEPLDVHCGLNVVWTRSQTLVQWRDFIHITSLLLVVICCVLRTFIQAKH